MNRFRWLSAILLTFIPIAYPSAQPPRTTGAGTPRLMAAVDPPLFRGLKYRLVGPSRGGRVTTVTGVPSQPHTFYIGVASGGLLRTTDGGTTWVPIADGKIPLGSMGSIAVADSDPNVIYVGTGSDGVRSNVSTGRGVYKTTDGGVTWQFVGLYNAGQIGAVRIHPTNPNIVWVAAYGDAFKRNTERGVFKTDDGGKSWRKVLFINDGVGAMDLELQPANPNVVYTWMSRLERRPWTIISGSSDGGFFKSTDGGEHFTHLTSGLPADLIGKANLAVTNAKPDRIYALIEARPGGGFYRSDDAGQSWTLVNSQGALIQRPFYYTTLGADPTNADVVYAGAESFFKSTDGGKTFTALRTPHGDNHDIWINPRDGNIMIQSNDGGANVSFDGGRTWSSQLNQVTGEFYGVWVDNQFPYKLYGAQQDASTPTRVVREDPDREGLLYAGTEFGMYISFDNGAHWQPSQLNLPNVPITDIKVHHKDLIVATQGRAFWILDNVSSLHQLAPGFGSSDVHLFKPRDGYRTRSAAGVLGPNIEYYLPAAPTGPVTIEILDAAGAIVNSYSSDAPAGGGRGGRGRAAVGAPAEADDPDAAPVFGRGRGRFVSPATKTEGVNRFVWDLRHSAGILAPPEAYQARLRVGDVAQTQPFTVLIDPNVAADGVTVADLKEQFEHNLRMRQLITDVNQVAARLREAQAKVRADSGGDAKASQLEAIAAKLFTEPVRYGKPGLQAHITYLAGMTNGADQKIGRDAIERYATLRQELDAIRAELDRVLNP